MEKIIDELTNYAYDQFDEVNHKDDLRGWLIGKADLLFEETVSNRTLP